MLENLNSPQREAVEHTDGPILVLAGAGTGKTKVLTSRIIHIVNTYKASPYQILAVTFTNKAAAEMKKRIGEAIGDQVNNLWVGTFHSIAARILRRHPEAVGLRSDFTIIDDDDQTRLLKQILNDFNIDPKQFPAKGYLNRISRLKDKVVTPQAIDSAGFEVSLPKLKDVYETYQNRLKAMNAADFGDLLVHNLSLFAAAPDVLAYYQDKFRYVLVDEYQDTNNAQYQWLLRLADAHKNICCVGDDDQSIYSWRGANIANILRFEKEFVGAKVIRLEQNYRSTSRILKAADSVISNNKERHGKTLWTDAGEGEKVKVLSFADDRTEARTIAQMIKVASAGRFKPSQIAVLVRAGYQTRAFEEAFIQHSLPYKVIGGMKFYERLEIRDAIAYLRICANPDDDLALSRIINVPKRGAGDAAISALYERSKLEGISFFSAIKRALEENALKGKARDALKLLIEQIEKTNAKIGSATLGELAKNLLTEVGYIAMWKAENTLESQGRLENIDEFIGSLGDFSSMVEFLEYVSLIEAREDKNLVEAVSVMTVHGAKGLEFDLVFVPGLEDGLFPSGRSIEERNGIEEERRLMYVAITRAKKELILSHAKSRFVFGDFQMQMPSRFLKELPVGEVNVEEVFSAADFSYVRRTDSHHAQSQSLYSAPAQVKKIASPASKMEDGISGKRVFHQKFGYGKVLNIDGNKLEIAFEKSGTKIVMKDFVALA
ncbi:MAG: UvrD-helicase domain-containing protein [Rickettsiales bacterium]|nr:UvrD-helicase domain-containing protein [Rickettsiales bacterium]